MRYKLSILFAIAILYSFSVHSQTVEFIENKGQWDSRVKYMGTVGAGAFFIEDGGYTVVQHNTDDWGRLTESIHGHSAQQGNERRDFSLRSHAFKVRFEGGNANAQVIADKPLPTYNNYFIGDDPSEWASNCRIYQGITIKNIYPNIDIRYYSGDGTVKYDLIVHPGGNPANIALRYEGADGLEVKAKNLHIKTSAGDLKELDPYTYQYNESGRVKIDTRYVVKKNLVTFDVKNYNPKTTLVIDPNLVFCSFSGSRADNWGFTATYGPDGAMYGGGIVYGQGFPTTAGSFQSSAGGGQFDIGLIKLTPDGSTRVYATYIGGGGEEQPHSLVVDQQGNLILAGRTNSPSTGGSGRAAYPLQGPAGMIGPGGGYDIVITKLNSTGNALIGSVRLGGTGDDGVNISASRQGRNSLQQNYGDDGRSEVNLDAAGNIYVASCTRPASDNTPPNFPVRNAFQPVAGGRQDGVLLKFDPALSNYLFGSFIGGSGNDAAYVVSIHPTNGNVYVAGGTESTNLLDGTRTGSLGATAFGAIDGFVSIVNASGAAVVRTSYIGTGGDDQVYGIQFDNNGFPYVMGQTTGNWQVINAAWSQPRGKQFIAKLRPDLSAYVYSTMFGKGNAAPDISPVAFLVDRCENVYISGWGGRLPSTGYLNAGVDGLPVTADALKSAPDISTESGLGNDFYFFVLKRDATSQLYGSFFGQNGGQFGDHVDGGTSRFDQRGVIYQAMCASCNNNLPFPTTAGAWATTKPTQACNLAMVKIAFNLDGVQGSVRSSIRGIPRKTNGCVPLTVDFNDSIQEAKQYEWHFGDGSPVVTTTASRTQHTFDQVGTYRVMMIAIDPEKCITRDTSYVLIRASDNEAKTDFTPVKLSPPCDTFRYRFDNTSIAPAGIPFKAGTFTWDFGDNTGTVKAGPEPVFHTYAAPGTYIVKLILEDTSYCNSPDTVSKILRVAANVKAAFRTPPTGCAPYSALFENESQGGAQFLWDFGDGNTSTDPNPSHTFQLPGTYLIRLTATDPNTCNITDNISFTINVYGNPTSDFTASPQPPVVNTPILFNNLASADAVQFKWLFGDGDSLITTSRNPVSHEYNLTNTYNACLIAYNEAGCPAQVCRQVSTLVETAVDVPTAFTPLSNDVNSVVFVRGYGIAKMRFAIYARWGEKVFETNDKKLGWDGRYKGKLLPMDAYAYTLDVEFFDGRKYRKTGDITLIR